MTVASHLPAAPQWRQAVLDAYHTSNFVTLDELTAGAGAHGVGQLHDARIGAQRGAVGEEAGRRRQHVLHDDQVVLTQRGARGRDVDDALG